MSDERKLSDPEKGVLSGDEDETVLTNDTETIEMLPHKKDGEAKRKTQANEFYGLSKEELEKFANDPFWVRVRWILFAIFLAAWIAMLVAAIVIVVLAPKCPPRPTLHWWQKDAMYNVLVSKFKDTNGDGKGDLKGVENSLAYFDKLGAMTLLLSDVYDRTDLKKVAGEIGGEDQFGSLVKAIHKMDMHVVMEVKDSDRGGQFDDILEHWLNKDVDGFYVTSDTERFDAAEVKKWKEILAEKSSQTDKIRTMMFAVTDSSAKANLSALDADLVVNKHLTTYSQSCNAKCVGLLIEDILRDEQDNKWPSFLIGDSTVSRAASRAGDYLKLLITAELTLKGTPIIYYGDDIGMQDDPNKTILAMSNMQWQSSAAIWNASNPQLFDASIQAQTAAGFIASLVDFYHDMIKLRSTAESLQWGSTRQGNCTGLVTFTRSAEGFSTYLIALNMNPRSSHPFVGDLAACNGLVATNGTVAALILAPHTEVNEQHLAVDKDVSLKAVYLPSGAGLVMKLSEK